MKKYIFYLCLFGIVFVIGFVNNMMVKFLVLFGEEVKFILKSVYLIVLLFGYIIVFKELKNKEYVFYKIIIYFLYVILILSIIMIVVM